MSIDTLDAEIFLEQKYQLGEGPLWSPDRGLTWVDIANGQLFQKNPLESNNDPRLILDLPEPLGVAVPHSSGGWLCGAGTGIRLFDGANQLIASVNVLPDEVRMNDGKVDALGRFWVGSKALDDTPGRGSLFRQDLNGSVHQVLTGLTITNGLGWDPQNQTMYVVDSPEKTVYAFDFDLDSGAITRQRPLIVFGPDEGYPDGLCVDADGCLWIAAWGGQAVFRHAPDGQRIGKVTVPTPHVTSCCFVDRDLNRLLITTAWDELRPEVLRNDSGAGRLWITGRLTSAGVSAPVAHVIDTDWVAAQ